MGLAVCAGSRIDLKIVYCGPALSGKTTNLIQLHTWLQPQRKGELMVLETKDDRTLFFDLLPVGLRTETGLDLRVKIYTVPGQVQHDGTRKAVLSRADGVIFIADSQCSQQENNAISFENLAENLYRVGLDIASVPLAIQFNKRDLRAIVSDDEIADRWGKTAWSPVMMASAIRGNGVVETFRLALERIYAPVSDQFGLLDQFGLEQEAFVDMLGAFGGQQHVAL